MRWRDGALAAALAVCGARVAHAQDSVPPPVTRHLLGLAFARVQPFHRVYDVNVLSGDSAVYIGRRDVVMSEGQLPDSTNGWLLTETRDGTVPAVDSLFLGLDLRPVLWTARSGGAHLELEFAGDSLYGTARSARSNAAIVAECPPDLIVSGAMLDLVLSLMPFSAAWADSAHMLSAGLAGARVGSVELLVMGEDSTAVPGGQNRPVWLVGLNAEAGRLVLWLDKATGALVRSQQALASHAGTMLEYRERTTSFAMPPQ